MNTDYKLDYRRNILVIMVWKIGHAFWVVEIIQIPTFGHPVNFVSLGWIQSEKLYSFFLHLKILRKGTYDCNNESI